MSMRVKIRLADIPDFAWKEYHEDQVRVYGKLTEFAFEASVNSRMAGMFC
jgi:hypothetical protein